MLHGDITSAIVERRIQELIAEAERERLVRSAHPPRVLLRVRAVQLVARALRVERELDFETARVSGR
jgi:hypothetical protein